jgi:uncharacterized protein YecE (DUF72 family)
VEKNPMMVLAEKIYKENYLKEYAKNYSTVEIDQWFWSLFPGYPVKLPDLNLVEEYHSAVSDNFKFSVKVPNSITLTHYYSHPKKGPLESNPHFFSKDLFYEFLERLSPLKEKLGPIMFQFEYLNKQKMPNQKIFMEKFGNFIKECPGGYNYSVETRNPNYLNKSYFEFLQLHGLHHVFLQGYYMPSILEVFDKFKSYIKDLTVIRLHGPNRQEIEKITKKKWNKIVMPKDDELLGIAQLLDELTERGVETFVNVNNHYEGSAPKTIKKLMNQLRTKE